MKNWAVISLLPLLLVFAAFESHADTQNMTLLGHGGGSCSGVSVSGQYAYVVDYSGLTVLDISTPGAPVFKGHTLLPGGAGAVHVGTPIVSGGYAYLPWNAGLLAAKSAKATGEGGIHVIDVRNAASPQLVGSFEAAGAVLGMAVRDNLAYVSFGDEMTYQGGLQVVDLTVPTAPAPLGQCSANASFGVALAGNKAYLATFGGLSVIDISTPSQPQVLGSYTIGSNPLTLSLAIAISGNLVYLLTLQSADFNSCTYSLEILDVSNSGAPVHRGSCALMSFSRLVADVGGLALTGHYVMVADNEGGLQVVDVANPASPQLVVSRSLPSEAMGIALSGTTAYVANAYAGLEVVNVANPANPVLQRSVLPGAPQKTAVAGGYAYTVWEHHFHRDAIWRHSGGMRITALPGMSQTTVIDAPGRATGVAVARDRAYVAWYNDEASSFGVEIYDVHTPTAPVRLGTYTPVSMPLDIVASGNYIFIADGSGIESVDLTDLAHPQSHLTSFTTTDELSLDKTTLVAQLSMNVCILIDVSNPASPVVASEPVAVPCKDAKQSGNITFIVAPNGLVLADRAGNQIGSYLPGDGTTMSGVAVSGRLAYVVTASGVTVLDLISPGLGTPSVVGSYAYAGINAKLLCQNGVVYVSDTVRGLFELRYAGTFSSDLRAKFDDQWAALCEAYHLGDADTVDLNGDGLPERWALRLVADVLDTSTYPFHEAACTAYLDNIVALSTAAPEALAYRECLAALLLTSSNIGSSLPTALGLTGAYDVVTAQGNGTNEPFSGAGNPSRDGVSNAQRYANVTSWGGSIDQFALYVFQTGFDGSAPLPAVSMLGMAVTLLGCLAAGVARTRRRRQ